MAATADSLGGHVVVLAADDDRLADAVAALLGAGALVGVVTNNAEAVRRLTDQVADEGLQPPLMFRADPADAESWPRIAPHLEQRLGPVDAVVADAASMPTVADVFGPDLRRRGHGDVLELADDVVSAVGRAIRHRP